MSFGIYMAGYVILLIGLGIGAHMLHIPPKWIAVGLTILVGAGILSGVSATRRRDP